VDVASGASHEFLSFAMDASAVMNSAEREADSDEADVLAVMRATDMHAFALYFGMREWMSGRAGASVDGKTGRHHACASADFCEGFAQLAQELRPRAPQRVAQMAAALLHAQCFGRPITTRQAESMLRCLPLRHIDHALRSRFYAWHDDALVQLFAKPRLPPLLRVLALKRMSVRAARAQLPKKHARTAARYALATALHLLTDGACVDTCAGAEHSDAPAGKNAELLRDLRLWLDV
jgi:hypothetical protein